MTHGEKEKEREEVRNTIENCRIKLENRYQCDRQRSYQINSDYTLRRV
jgi:hypothetical protein